MGALVLLSIFDSRIQRVNLEIKILPKLRHVIFVWLLLA